MKLLEIKDLEVRYVTQDSIVNAVNGISLDMESGETLGLVGETGAGKTTVARAILRLIPSPPGKISSGEIYFEGENLLHKTDADMRKIRGKDISMIFQDPMTSLNPVMGVADQIAEVIRIHEKISKKECHLKALEMLEMVGIPADRG